MTQDSRKERLWFLDLAYPEEHLKLISKAWCGGAFLLVQLFERLRWQDCELACLGYIARLLFKIDRQTDRCTLRFLAKRFHVWVGFDVECWSVTEDVSLQNGSGWCFFLSVAYMKSQEKDKLRKALLKD